MWHELAITLIKAFVDKLYNFQKKKYYSDKIELAVLDNSNPNFVEEYNFLVKKTEYTLIESIKNLKEKITNKEFIENFSIGNDFEALHALMHLYQPLIYIEQGSYKDVIKLQPVPLNKGERDLVEDLKLHFSNNTDFFKDKQLYLLRNLSKKGIGFFEADNFFPDFILWLVIKNKQYISFIDPKGLRQIQGLTDKSSSQMTANRRSRSASICSV